MRRRPNLSKIMMEYKAKYPHAKAREIIDKIGAMFAGKEEIDDFYLKLDKGNIFKLQKNGDNVYLIILSHNDGGFSIELSEYLSKDISNLLLPLFKGNQYVLTKNRELYSWKGSKIELDSVEKYGEFIEFYPIDNEAKLELFEKFGVKESDLVVKSYFNL